MRPARLFCEVCCLLPGSSLLSFDHCDVCSLRLFSWKLARTGPQPVVAKKTVAYKMWYVVICKHAYRSTKNTNRMSTLLPRTRSAAPEDLRGVEGLLRRQTAVCRGGPGLWLHSRVLSRAVPPVPPGSRSAVLSASPYGTSPPTQQVTRTPAN